MTKNLKIVKLKVKQGRHSFLVKQDGRANKPAQFDRVPSRDTPASDRHYKHKMTSLSTPRVPRKLSSHLPSLDGIRGLAVLLVLVDMLNVLQHGDGLTAYLFERISSVGWVGVQLFFVLSGFLISGILLDTQTANNYYSGFYARRTLRIFPLYFLVLGVSFIVLPQFDLQSPSLVVDQKNQWWLWLYLSNWAPIFEQGSTTFPHFWSLAVEEQFYLIWPFFLHRMTARQCLLFCILVAALSLIIRGVLVAQNTAFELIYQNSFCRMDALALGGAAAAYLRIPGTLEQLQQLGSKLVILLMAITAFGVIITRGFWNDTVIGATLGYSIVALIFTVFLLRATIADMQSSAPTRWQLLRHKSLRQIGQYSYAMYILHLPLHHFVGRPLLLLLPIDVSRSILLATLYMVLAIGCSFALAWLSWQLFEKHFLKLKRYFVAAM